MVWFCTYCTHTYAHKHARLAQNQTPHTTTFTTRVYMYLQQGALRLLQTAGRHAAALRALENDVAAALAKMHEQLFGAGAAGVGVGKQLR